MPLNLIIGISRYLREKNNACHRRVDWLIYMLLTKVVLYYNHMQRLKEAGFVRPRKIEEQLNSSKCRASQIQNEDCVPDENSNNGYWVRSQNKDTRDIGTMSYIKVPIYTFVIAIGP